MLRSHEPFSEVVLEVEGTMVPVEGELLITGSGQVTLWRHLIGEHSEESSWEIPDTQVKKIADAITTAGFASLQEEYLEAQITDVAYHTLTVTYHDGSEKRVRHYSTVVGPVPEELVHLEERIRKLARVEKHAGSLHDFIDRASESG